MQEVSGRLYICLILWSSHFTLHSCNATPESAHFLQLRHHQKLIRIELPLITWVQIADLPIALKVKSTIDLSRLK